jgi:hypothetical protein
MPRERTYSSNAARQAAYRQRQEVRRRQDAFRDAMERADSTLLQHLGNLRKEITRVRAENKCQRDRQRWNPHFQHVGQLISLLDFIENELDKTCIDGRGKVTKHNVTKR